MVAKVSPKELHFCAHYCIFLSSFGKELGAVNGIDLFRYFEYFHRAAAIPVTLLDGDDSAVHIPGGDWPVLLDSLRDWMREKEPVSFLMTGRGLFFGRLRVTADPSKIVVLGPVSPVPVNPAMVEELLPESGGSSRKSRELTTELEAFPVTDFHRFLHVLCFLHYAVNGTAVTPEDLSSVKDRRYAAPIEADFASQTVFAKEHERFHNTYELERQILHLVEKGDAEGLKKLLERPLHLVPGIVAEDSLRQVKDLFIASATLVTRAAIRGGLDIQEAYQLSDVYIRNMERLTSIPSILRLQYQMVLDFAERVAASGVLGGLSRTVRECIAFIRNRTNQPVTVDDVAKHVNLSRSHLSRKFKSEMGIGINAYINRQKIEEAKRLLAHTRLSLGEISHYLCFSSQSYFQKVFKKATGVTPNRYRAARSPWTE